MSPIDSERFFEEMQASFRSYVDDIWGPYRGPGGPRMGPFPEPWRSGPFPDPWRELGIAYEVVKLADYLELGSEGLGVGMVRRFAEEPLDPCGTRPPGWPFPPHREGGPPPPGEEPIVRLTVLGAALAFVGEGAGSEAVRAAAVEAGRQIAG